LNVFSHGVKGHGTAVPLQKEIILENDYKILVLDDGKFYLIMISLMILF